jgi:hypothetical protein
MKRSSQRGTRRWVLQELTRCLEQRSEPPLDQTRFIEGKLEQRAFRRIRIRRL